MNHNTKDILTGLSILQDLNQNSCESEFLYQILDNIVSKAIKLSNAKTGIIYILDKEGKNVIDRFTPNEDSHLEPRLNRKDGLTFSVFVTKEIIYIPRCDDDERVNPELRNKYKSILAIPLKLKDSVIGVLFLNSDQIDGFSILMQKFLFALASQSAAIIYIKKFESMVNSLTQCIFQKDKDSKFTFANKAFIETIKHKLDRQGDTYLDKLTGCTDFDIYDDLNLVTKYIADDKSILSGEKPIIETIELHNFRNKSIWVKVVKTPLYNRDKEIIGTEAIFWDVNEEVIALEREKIIQSRYEDLFQQSPDGIVIHNNGIISHVNKAAMDLFGVKNKEDLEGHYIIDLIFERDKQLAQERLNAMLNDKTIIIPPDIMRLQKQDGSKNYSTVKVYAKPSTTQDKEIQVVFHKLAQDQNTVFVSYSNEDKDIVDEMLQALHPLKHLNIQIWAAHKDLKNGNWHETIQKELVKTKIAILMESVNFVNSEYINNSELPLIIKDYQKGEITIFRVLVSDDLTKSYLSTYPKYLTGGLNSIQMINNNRPIRKMDIDIKKKFWDELSDSIIREYNLLTNN